MKSINHPVSEGAACAFHLAFVAGYLLALGFHLASAIAHWRDR